MDLGNGYGHLTYSMLVHPGDSWSDMKTSLTTYMPEVKKRFSPDAKMGVSFRMANATVHIYTATASGLLEENPTLFSVFPNPTSGIFNVKVNQAGTIKVLDMSGKVVLDRQVDASEDNIQIDLSKNGIGLFLIRFTNQLNQESLVKIIVE